MEEKKQKESTTLLLVTGAVSVIAAPLVIQWAYSASPADPPWWLWVAAVVGLWGAMYSGAVKTAVNEKKLDRDD